MIDETLEEIEAFRDELRRPPPNMTYRQRPRLREEIRSLLFAIDGAAARPSAAQLVRLEELDEETVQAMGAYERLVNTRVADINAMMRQVPQVVAGGLE